MGEAGGSASNKPKIHVWRLRLTAAEGGSCLFDDPEQMRDDLMSIDVDADSIIKVVSDLRPGERCTHPLFGIRCHEMTRDEYDTLPEFGGW